MKTTVRKNITDLPYSLHDAIVTGIEFAEDKVTFRFAEGFFEPYEGDCRRVEGCVEIEGVDYDFCSVYVLNCAKKRGQLQRPQNVTENFCKEVF